MGVEAVFSWAVFLIGAEQAAFVDSEGAQIQLSGVDRSFDLGKVFGIAHSDGELAGVQFDVFATAYLVNVEVSKGHADFQFGFAGDLDPDLKVVVRTAGDFEAGVVPGLPALHLHVGNVVLVPAFIVNRDEIAIAPGDAHGAGPDFELQATARNKLGLEMVFSLFDEDSGFLGEGNRNGQQQENCQELEHGDVSVMRVVREGRGDCSLG